MFALVHPDGSVLEAQSVIFPVHPDMRWVDIGANIQNIGRGWTHDGLRFIAPLPQPPPPIRQPSLTVDALADLLVAKGVVTKAEIDGKKK